MKRGLLALALLSVLGASAEPTTEAEAVARTVTANADWMRDAEQCPARLMPHSEASDAYRRNDCAAGRLGLCLGRCTGGTPGACYWLATALQAQGQEEAAEALYQQACKLGVMSGCTNRAAGMFKDATSDTAVAACTAATFEATCAADDPWGCTMLALQLSRGIGVKPDRQRALQVLGKSCKYGPEDEACVYGERLKRELQDAGARQAAKP